MNQINGGLKGSCETARMLVDSTTTNGQWEFMKWDALDSAAASGGQWLDNYDDTLDARENQDKIAEDAPPEVKYNNEGGTNADDPRHVKPCGASAGSRARPASGVRAMPRSEAGGCG